MAGGATTYGNTAPPGAAPPGYVWSAALGGYVPATAAGTPRNTTAADTGINPLALQQLAEQTRASQAGEGLQRDQFTGTTALDAQRLAEQTREAQAREALQRDQFNASQTFIDPLAAQQLAEQTREARVREDLQREQFTASQTGRASALAALTQLGTTGGGTGEVSLPPAPDTSAADRAAETATLTASKERRGQQLRSGLRGLASRMRSRGIAGSGSEGAGISNFYAATQADAADTENQLIQAAAARRHGVSDMTYQAGVNAAMQNASARQASASQRLQALMQLYGMSY